MFSALNVDYREQKGDENIWVLRRKHMAKYYDVKSIFKLCSCIAKKTTVFFV